MTLSLEYLVRHEAGKLLRDRSPGRFFCVPCLAAFLRPALGTDYTKVQIERALQAVSKTPAALTYKHTFVCDQCGKTMPCLGVK
jgi:hypothetical protein